MIDISAETVSKHSESNLQSEINLISFRFHLLDWQLDSAHSSGPKEERSFLRSTLKALVTMYKQNSPGAAFVFVFFHTLLPQ